jgi:hypothetical protein
MRHLDQDELTQMMGVGYLGEVRQGPDGNLYQWVEAVDGLGNPVGGLWRRLRRIGRGIRRVVRRVARRAGVAGHTGLGALYQAPDGTVYQLQGLAQEEELPRQDELTQMMGVGYLGEMRQGPDGNLYQWVGVVDGLGNPIGGLWRRIGRRLRRGVRRVRRGVRRALTAAQRVASAIPLPQAQAVAAGIRVDRRAGVAGHTGLGALYQAPDGTVYQAQEEDLQGLAEENEEELQGLAEEEELEGLAEEEELEGLAEEEELEGLSEEEELQGLGQGYIRVQEPGMGDLDAYVPETPPQTRWFSPPATPPKLWEPLW